MIADSRTKAYERTEARRKARRNQARQRINEQNELSPLQKVHNRRRKNSCRRDLQRFCEKYLPGIFCDPWSDHHKEAITRIEAVVLNNELFAFAMPRGFGKTALCLAACLWAILYGHVKWICMAAATGPMALTLLADVKRLLMESPELFEDFPEACFPMLMSEDKGIKAANLRWKGEIAGMSCNTTKLVLPNIPGAECANAIITVTGITGGGIRGQRMVLTDESTGKMIIQRPDCFLVDDPQTYVSAHSNAEIKKRLGILGSDIKKLSRQGRSMSGFVPVTVISPGDMADQLLDPEKFPEYHGKRTKLLETFPDRMDLWEQYDDIRRIELAGGGDGKTETTTFYVENQKAMDEGAEVAWPYLDVEFSTVLQYCMHRFLEDPASFYAEDQNEPQSELGDTESQLTRDEIARRTNAYRKGVVPAGADIVTGHIDVQLHCLFYAIVAWRSDGTGYTLEYGTFPRQRQKHFEYKKISRTLAKEFPGLSKEARIRKAVSTLVDDLCGRRWEGDDGTDHTIKRLLIDGNWQADEIYQECRESQYRGVVMPARGKFVGAGTEELNEHQKREAGKRLGLHWRVQKSNRIPIKFCTFDSNYWKTWIHNRYATDPKERGALTLYDAPPRSHATFAAHQVAEYSVKTEGRGRVVYEWKQRPDRPDNHWFDNMVGAAVAASIEGVALSATGVARKKTKKRAKKRVEYL